MIIFPTPEQNLFLKAWIEERLQASLGRPADVQCLGVMRDKRLLAVAAYNNYKTLDIELSFAAEDPRWATKQTVTWILSYPFVQLKTQRVTAVVKKSNRKARRLLLGVGFKEEGAHRHAGANLETTFSYGMVRPDFMERYLSGKEKPAGTASRA